MISIKNSIRLNITQGAKKRQKRITGIIRITLGEEFFLVVKINTQTETTRKVMTAANNIRINGSLINKVSNKKTVSLLPKSHIQIVCVPESNRNPAEKIKEGITSLDLYNKFEDIRTIKITEPMA
ncbi:MAG: hypothetical protein U0L11_06125 [Acutalibacteraceae bacterium]|nr:hypothetical protein [Acutalibacteraceae bacterium]